MSSQTRVDFAFAVNYVARYSANPEQPHMDAVVRIYADLAGTPDLGIQYARREFRVFAFSDADFAGCLDTRRSTTGYVFTLGAGPVSWSSRRQNSVSTSTVEAEYMAVSAACKEAIWLRWFINDLGITKVTLPFISIGIDNEAAEGLTRNPLLHDRAKHIDIQYHFVRERVLKTKDVKTCRVLTADNLADILTKPMLEEKFQVMVERLGMRKG